MRVCMLYVIYIYTIYCAKHSTRYTVHSTRYTVHSTQYTVYSIQYTVHGTQYTVYSTQYTVHSTEMVICIAGAKKRTRVRGFTFVYFSIDNGSQKAEKGRGQCRNDPAKASACFRGLRKGRWA